jgi:transposase
MIRSVKYKLYPNKCKMDILQQITDDYQEAVNHYIKSFIEDTPYSRKNCYKDHDSGLLKTKRLEDNAAMTAYDVVSSWIKGPKKSIPVFNGGLKLNAKNIQIQESDNSFDKWLYIQPYKLHIPFNLYNHKWLRGNELKELTIINKNNKYYVKISYEVEPKPIEHKKEMTSIDVGINKLMTTPYGTYGDKKLKEQIKNYSNRIRELRKRINRSGSKSSKKLKRLEEKFSSFTNNVYNREINKLIKNEAPKMI